MTGITYPTANPLNHEVSYSRVFRSLSGLLVSIAKKFLPASLGSSENRGSDTPSEKSGETLSAGNLRPNTQVEIDTPNPASHTESSEPNKSLEPRIRKPKKSESDQSELEAPVSQDQDPAQNPEEQSIFSAANSSDPVQLESNRVGNREASQGTQEDLVTRFQPPRNQPRGLELLSAFVDGAASIARAGFVYSVVGHLPWLALSVYFRVGKDYYFAPDYLLDMPTGVIHWTGVVLGTIAGLLWFSVRDRELREARNDSVQVVTYSAKDPQAKAEPSVYQYKNATIIDRSAEQKLDGGGKIDLRAVRIPGRVAGSIFNNLRNAVLDVGLLGTLYWASKLSATVGYSTIPSNPGPVFWVGLSCVALNWIFKGVEGFLGRLQYRKPH